VARLEACLVDAYDTIVTCDFRVLRREVPALAGIPADIWDTEYGRLGPFLTDGRMSKTEAFGQILRASGQQAHPGLVAEMVLRDAELLLANARLFDDVIPFLDTLRGRGIKIAVVSNCTENTRPLLTSLGVDVLADALVLSCEVGAAKPAAGIFRYALDRLGVTAEAAVFVDDQPGFCAGSVAVGISAVQIVRGESDGRVSWDGEVVRSLREVEAMLLSRAHLGDFAPCVILASGGAVGAAAGCLGAGRFDRAGGDVSGHVPGRGVGVMGRLDQVSQGEAGRELAADLLGQRVAVLNRAIAVTAPAFVVGRSAVEKGIRWRTTNSALVSSASMSKMNKSGFMNPASNTPAGRKTRQHSRQTGARSGQNRFDTGLKTRSKRPSTKAPRSRMSPSTVLMARPSRAATSSSRPSCLGELSNTVTSAPAAARTGPC